MKNWTAKPKQEEMPCKEAHKIDGVIPQSDNIEFDGRACDCGKLVYVAEDCGCPVDPHKELKSKPNPNYI